MIKKILMVVVIAFFILNSVAFAVVSGMNFTDQSKFADWNSTAISHLKGEGIIQGYSDGEFKPENSVTRAEMAVMMDRMYDKLVGKMGKITMSYEELKDVSFTNTYDHVTAKVALAMGMAHVRETSQPDLKKDYCTKLDGKNLPQNYEVYSCGELFANYYAHEYGQTGVPESGDGIITLNSWFGPFDASTWYNNG